MVNDEISRYLAAIERDDCYRVDAVLKESQYEVTQRVFFVGANGAERGPYIRKLINRDSGMGDAYMRIFEVQQEGRRFKHIPKLHDCYHDERHLVVVMEFVEGETLQDVVYQHDPSLQLAREVFPLVCDAVTELHESFDPPLIHRDLKPSNVMLAGGTLTIIDFGIARAFREGAEADTVKFGTRAFAPPEQFGFGQTTVQSDVYALGMLLYYCLTEKIPTQQVRDLKFEGEGIPTCLQPVLVRATALDMAERYATVKELKVAFQEALNGEKRRDRRSRNRNIIAALVACVAVAAVVGGFTLITAETPNSSKNSPQSTSAESQSSSKTSGGDSEPSSQGDDNASAAVAASSGMQTAAPPRNGFDPATNVTVEMADVAFQIPSCFEASVVSNDEVTYHYAESGSSCALIMTADSTLENTDGKNGAPQDPKAVMNDYLVGLMSSDKNAFQEATSMTDCSLAGYNARIVTFNGTVKDLPLMTKLVYFFNPDENAIGALMFGQTENAQFDYSADFARSVASASRIARE